MSLADCIKEVIEASGGVLTHDQAKDLLSEYKDAAQQMSTKDRFATLDTILAKAHQQKIDGVQVALLRERATRVRIALDHQRMEETFNATPKQGNMPIHQAFLQMFRNKESEVETSRRLPKWWFNNQLEKNGGAAAIALKSQNMLDQAVDLFFEPRSSRNLNNVPVEVKSLVEALDSTTDFVYTAANKVGGYLNWRPTILFSGRVAVPELLHAVGKEEFVNKMVDLMSDDVDTLNKHGIFKHDDLEARLEKFYDLSVKGQQIQTHGSFEDSTQPLVKQFYGKSVNKISDSIFDLPFKDGAAYRQFFQEFNGKDMSDVLIGNLRQVGRNLGMVRAFGPVPEIGFENMIKAATSATESAAEKAAIEGKPFEAIDKQTFGSAGLPFVGQLAEPFEKNLRKIGKAILPTEANPQHWYKVLAGETDRVHDQSWANWGKAVRGFTSLSRLIGFGHMTQWGDLPTTMAVLSKLDDNPMRAFAETMKSYVSAYDPTNKLDFDALNALGAAFDIHHGNMLDMYYSGDSSMINPKRADMFDTLFKYTGMARMDWVRIKSINEYLNTRMASALNSDYNSAHPDLRMMMQKVGITEADWDGLKTGVNNGVLAPEGIQDAEVMFRYLRMQNEINRIAVPRPGAMEQAIINRGTNPGTPEGEIFRTIGLFKSFGIAMATRVLPFLANDVGLVGKMTWMSGMVFTYIMRDAVKQALLGKTSKWLNTDTYAGQDPWSDASNITELLTFSGMGGVYGDMIGSDMSKFGPGGGVAGALAGPLLTGPVQTGVDWWHTMFTKADAGKKEAKTVQAGIHLSGADNLPIITAAMNRMFLYSLYESLEPGWIQRHTNGLKSKGQSEF